MIIHGLNKLTLLDYPGLTACTLFTGGCNFRCPFCHNASLVEIRWDNPLSPKTKYSRILKSDRAYWKAFVSPAASLRSTPTLSTL